MKCVVTKVPLKPSTGISTHGFCCILVHILEVVVKFKNVVVVVVVVIVVVVVVVIINAKDGRWPVTTPLQKRTSIHASMHQCEFRYPLAGSATDTGWQTL